MGAYINKIDDTIMGPSALEKIKVLVEKKAIPLIDDKGELIESPKEFKENMVCVVDNGHFGACGYAWDEREFHSFLPRETDRRPRYWFIFNRAKECAEPKYWEKNEMDY